MPGKRYIEHSCYICGERFYSLSHNAKYCKECHEKYDREIHSEQNKLKYKIKKNSPVSKLEAIKTEIREIERYNKQHGTIYTYGQYERLKKEGQLDELESSGGS